MWLAKEAAKDRMAGVKATGKKTRELSVLLGTSEPFIEEVLRKFIGFSLRADYELNFTTQGWDFQLREAAQAHDYGLVVLYINTMYFKAGKHRIVCDLALKLIRELKQDENRIVLVLTSYRPPGFATAAEQAGADGIIDVPFTLAVLRQAILGALELRA